MKKTGKMKKILSWLSLTLFLIGLGLAAGAYFLKFPHEFWDAMIPLPHGEQQEVVIRPGFNARQSAQAFYDQGALLGSPAELAHWMARFGIDRRIRPGQYQVIRATPWNMARQLLTVQPVSSSLTIIPGMDIVSIRDMFGLEHTLTEQNLRNLASLLNDSDPLSLAINNDLLYPEPMRKFLPENGKSRLALLLPETYFVLDESPEELVRVASHHWWNRFGERLPAHVTPEYLEERAIVASMIEKEARWDVERPIIAGVIENRLRRNMLLQIDATVVYGWRLRGENLTRVFFRHLELDCPYNTYIFMGLPPTPICIPSAESWEAALFPGENPYYFYVARSDGHHYFSRTYAEHRQNIRRARAN